MGVRVRVGSACVCGAAWRAGCSLACSCAMRCGLTCITCTCAVRLDARSRVRMCSLKYVSKTKLITVVDALAVPRRPAARRCPNLRMPMRKRAVQQHTL
eukprot:3079511-Pleurochrysis_carterae.AAC.2